MEIFSRRTPIEKILIVFTIVAFAVASYFTYLRVELRKSVQDVAQSVEVETDEEMLSRINKVYALPKTETPSIMYFDDIKSIPQQDFFKKALPGDRLVVYEKTGKAILYRPSTRQIIEISPISIIPSATP